MSLKPSLPRAFGVCPAAPGPEPSSAQDGCHGLGKGLGGGRGAARPADRSDARAAVGRGASAPWSRSEDGAKRTGKGSEPNGTQFIGEGRLEALEGETTHAHW